MLKLMISAAFVSVSFIGETNAAAANAQCDPNSISFLIVGESQIGKTTFIRSITGTEHGDVGNGDGTSVTSEAAVYEFNDKRTGMKMYAMDAPGFGDSDVRFPEGQILQSVAMKVSAIPDGRSCIDAILLGESLMDGKTQINQNMNRLRKEFGPNVGKSVIVIGLQPTMAKNNPQRKLRIPKVIETCEKNKLPFVEYESMQNFGAGPIQYDEDAIAKIVDIIQQRKVEPFHMDEINKFRECIERRAHELRDAAPITYNTASFTYNADKVKESTVRKCVGQDDGFWFFLGTVGQIFGADTKTGDYRYKNVPKFTPYTVPVTETTKVPETKDLEEFRAKARAEIEEQFRKRLAELRKENEQNDE